MQPPGVITVLHGFPGGFFRDAAAAVSGHFTKGFSLPAMTASMHRNFIYFWGSSAPNEIGANFTAES